MVSLNPLDKVNKYLVASTIILFLLFVASVSTAAFFYYKYDHLRSLDELTKAIEKIGHLQT